MRKEQWIEERYMGFRIRGYETGILSIVQSDNPNMLILKEEGHTYWSGLNMPRSYSPMRYHVYEILDKESDVNGRVTYHVNELTSFQGTQKRSKQNV